MPEKSGPISTPIIRVDPADPQRFSWRCPNCQAVNVGKFGITPVSGWDNPRWTLTNGDWDRPTLEPSLGCWNCYPVGHYWLREGELVNA